MKTIIYCVPAEKNQRKRKLTSKLPNYLIRRKILILRERIIARKYAEIYLRKVFGKYHPSECRRYYKNKILKKSFEKLREHWFDEKQVYRLLSKANIFFSEKLTRKTFNGWRFCAKKAKIVGEKARVVRYNYDNQLLRNIFCDWKTIAYRSRRYKMMKSHAIESCYLMYTLRLFLEIARYFSDQIERNLVEIKSILSGRFIVLRNCTRRWKMFLFQQRDERILGSKADNYYRFKISVFCFARWLRYVSHKRTKREIIQLCRGLYEDGLIKIILRMWIHKTRSKIIEKEQLLLAVKFHDDLIQRKLFKTWKRYVKRKLLDRSLKHKASFFYTMRLKQRTINALSKNVYSCKNTKLATKKLELFYRRLLLTNIFNKWTEMIDDKNDSELRNKLSSAASFYNVNVIRKYLLKWVGHKTSQQRKKALKLKAGDLCKTFYCQKYFNVWKIAYTKKRRIAMLEEKATKFSNTSVMQNAIMRWIISYNYTISVKRKLEESVLRHKRKILSKCFDSWIRFCNEKIRAQNLFNEATEYYSEMLKRKIFEKLSENVVRMKMKRGKIRVAENFYKNNLAIEAFENWKAHCFRIKELRKSVEDFEKSMRDKLKRTMIVEWKAYVHHKKCSRRKTSTSALHRRKKVCEKVFDRLRNYVNYKREKENRLAYLNSGVEGIKENIKTIYFQKWRVARLNILKEKSRMFHADQFHGSYLKKRYFVLWKTFVMQHKIKRKHQKSLNSAMNYFILKKCLRVWYTRYQASLRNSFNENWASRIYQMKVEYKYFTGWKCFAEISLREKKEMNNAKEFHKKLIIKEGLQHLIKLFLSKTESRFETNLSNVEKNSSHDFELLRKFFNKWHRSVFADAKNRLRSIKDQTIDVENVVPLRSKINDRKHVSNLIPRFIIPKFMRDEIKLRFGIGRSKIPSEHNLHSFVDQKFRRNIPDPQTRQHQSCQLDACDPIKLKNKLEDYETFTRKVPTRPPHSRLNINTNSPNAAPTISPDSLRSASDSAKTYIIQNPKYCRNLGKENSFSNSHCSKLAGETHNGNSNYKLLPPAAFYVSLKEL